VLVGVGANLRDIRRLHHAVPHNDPPVNDYVADIGGTGAVHDPRHEIRILGLRVRAREVVHDEIDSVEWGRGGDLVVLGDVGALAHA